MTDFSQLTYFQFENLVKNRIPFLLLTLDVDFENFYSGIYQRHLQEQIVSVTEDQIKNYVVEKQIPPHHSILIICRDGKKSSRLAYDLEKKGFLNCYSVQGGFQQLVKDKESYI